MIYNEQWKAIAARIRGLTQVAQLHASYLSVHRSDMYGRARQIRKQAHSVLDSLKEFKNNFEPFLPKSALLAIENFVNTNEELIKNTDGSADMLQHRVWAALVLLCAFETEMSYILSDIQTVIRARSELAFAHLQRLIVADPDVREKWKKAFANNEVACERLGAVHLLHHGIWAFKVDAIGGRTDLVYQDNLNDLSDDARYVDGIVLTEWKKAGHGERGKGIFDTAHAQAKLYASGILHGIELKGYRYLIVVSKDKISKPDDIYEDGVVYRHINIVVEPKTPSQDAKTIGFHQNDVCNISPYKA